MENSGFRARIAKVGLADTPVDEEYETFGGGLMVFDEKDWTARVRKAKTDADILAR
jgi:hypothetical protein